MHTAAFMSVSGLFLAIALLGFVAWWLIHVIWLEPERRLVERNVRDAISRAMETLDINLASRKLWHALNFMSKEGLEPSFRSFYTHVYNARERLRRSIQNNEHYRHAALLVLVHELKGHPKNWPMPASMYTHRVRNLAEVAGFAGFCAVVCGIFCVTFFLIAMGDMVFHSYHFSVSHPRYH